MQINFENYCEAIIDRKCGADILKKKSSKKLFIHA